MRALAFGDESKFIHELGYYVSVFTAPNHLDLDYAGRFYNVPGKTAGMYSARQNTEAKALFYFASPPLEYDRRDSVQQKRIVADTFAGEGWEMPRLLEAMWEAPDFYFDSISQIDMDTWWNGRAVLVGDAGYCASPLSGMGTGLAVVGAYVLAGELHAAGGDHRLAFARYQGGMSEYVRECQRQGLENGRWFVPRSRTWIRIRNQNYRMLPYLPWKGLIAKMLLRAANAIALQKYEGRTGA